MLRFAFMRAGRSACSTMCDWWRRQAWRALQALACSCSLWSAGLTITIGIAIDARQPLLAQEEQLGPSKHSFKTKEAREKYRKGKFADAKRHLKEALELSKKICGEKDAAKIVEEQKQYDAANAELQFDIDGIIINSDDLTEEQRSAIDQLFNAIDALDSLTLDPSRTEAQEDAAKKKVDDARQHFRDLPITQERRKAILEKLENGKEISYTPECPSYAVLLPPGPTITVSAELGWGGSRNGFEDYNFGGSGIIGGVSGQFNFPIGANTYAGVSVSFLGSGVSGALPDPTTSNIWWLLPVDGILGATFLPSGWRWPVSIYGFGGFALGDVNISAPPFSATQIMTGWSVGIGGEVQISPNWSVGLKYRHFDLGNANFSVFPGGTSFVSERGDMVTGTLTYRFPLTAPAPVAPMVIK